MDEPIFYAPKTLLTDRFAVSREAMSLEGGAGAFYARLAARLTDHFSHRDVAIAVYYSELGVTIGGAPPVDFVTRFSSLDDLQRDPVVLHELETVGSDRDHPSPEGHALHAQVASIIAAWPEVVAPETTDQEGCRGMHPLRRHHSPLSVDFEVSTSAIDLAGGVAAMNERFALRLGAHLRDRGEHFDVWHTDMMAIASGRTDSNNGIMLMIVNQWTPARFRGPTVTYHLEGVDAVRHIIAAPGCDDLEPDDPFWLLFASVRDLVLDWPEVERRLDRAFPSIRTKPEQSGGTS
jgi:hypothetical protein